MEPLVLLKLIVVSSILAVPVLSRVTVMMTLRKFHNDGSRLYQPGSSCGYSCETYFQICIKPSTTLPSNFNNCWYYADTKAKRIRKTDVNFGKDDSGMPQRIYMHNETWPGNIGFFLKAWDYVDSSTSQLIDIHAFRLPSSAEPNASISFQVFRTTGNRTNTPTSVFLFYFSIFCDQYYYGVNCRTYCKESNDGTNGRFTCGSSGSHKCRSGWFNAPKCLTNCVPKNDSTNGHYACTNNGTKICRQNWYGPSCLTQCFPKDNDRDGHYVCSKNGTHICKQNWYGPKCLTNCVPKNDIVGGYYTCSKNGRIICRRNWYGPKCLSYCIPKNDSTSGHYTCASNGTQICMNNWYGINCLINCVPKSNSVDGYSTCSKTGLRLCQNNWYGPKCIVHCVPNDDNKNGHYTCSTNGTIVCRPNWYGKKCVTHCVPRNDIVDGHYTCSTNGTIVCRPNWYGQKCVTHCVPKNDIVDGHYNCSRNGSRICRKGRFVLPKCLIYCVPQDDNTNGHYSCSSNGIKVCNPGWYGQKCLTHCEPKSDNTGQYTCAKDGTRVCHKNWTGQWCNVSVSTTVIRSSRFTSELKSSSRADLPSKFHSQSLSLKKLISSTTTIKSSPTLSTNSIKSQKASHSGRSARIHSTRHHETYTIKHMHSKTRVFSHSTVAIASVSSSVSIRPSQTTSVVPSTNVKSGTSIPGITVNKEGDQGIFSWLVNTSKGNTTVVGFGLAFIFFILLVVALVKICRLKRSKIRRRIFVNEALPRHREEINPMYDVPSRLYDRVNDVPLRQTRNNKVSESDDLQMCYGCFGRLPGSSQYAYQKGETGM